MFTNNINSFSFDEVDGFIGFGHVRADREHGVAIANNILDFV